jgi:quercetin dioxygenase-like cupin family protein
MSERRRWILALLLTATALGIAGAGGAHARGNSSIKAATVWPGGDLLWKEMPGMANVKVATLWGDLESGSHGALVRIPADNRFPLHTHSNAVKLVVISGVFHYAPGDGPDVELGPGSYLMVPGGLRHTSGTGDAQCELFQEGMGKWDIKPANPVASK